MEAKVHALNKVYTISKETSKYSCEDDACCEKYIAIFTLQPSGLQ
jgi:hypothetical protein